MPEEACGEAAAAEEDAKDRELRNQRKVRMTRPAGVFGRFQK